MELQKIKSAFTRCSIIYDSIECPLPPILNDNADFIMKMLINDHSRSISYQISNEFLPIVTLIIMGLYCLISDQTKPEEIVNNLKSGDYVIYNGSRGIFTGFDKNGLAVIKQMNRALPLIDHVPVSRFHLIKPYYGEATSLDGKGIRGIPSKRRNYLSSLLAVNKSELPAEVSNSVVIVTDRGTSDNIMRKTKLKVPSGNILPISGLFSSAYYTENDIYHYAGNIAKADPIFRFTGRVSIAREMIIEDDNEKIVSLVVCGQNVLESGESELMSLYGRRSLPHICIINRTNSWNASRINNIFPETQFFAWTKPVLKQYIALGKNYVDASEDSMSRKLTGIIGDICESNTQIIPCGNPISIEQNTNLRKALWQISKSDYSNPEKERFIVIGFSLLKLFTHSIVPLQLFERHATTGVINVRMPSDQLKELKAIMDGFDGILLEYMKIVFDGLSEFYSNIEYRNEKFAYLFDCLINSTPNDQYTVIVPKEYHALSFIACFRKKDSFILKRIRFVVSERHNFESDSGNVICTGAFSSKHFNPYNDIARNISILSYSHEKSTLSYLSQVSRRLELLYSGKNIAEKMVFAKAMPEVAPQEDLQENLLTEELETYIKQVTISNAVATVGANAVSGHSMVPICRIVLFESGQKAFLTKYYIAYSLNETLGTVIEKGVSDLRQGDYLVFRNFGDQAGDIVDELLQQLVENKNSDVTIAHAFELSKRWKIVLGEYMRSQKLSFQEVSKKLSKLGHKKHEVTIRSWLNNETHIVGPREEDSFIAIALITGDTDMLDNPQKYRDACRLVRATRIRILKYIGINIINAMGHKDKNKDEFLESIIGDVSGLAGIQRIENIVEPTNLDMPVSVVNQPQI